MTERAQTTKRTWTEAPASVKLKFEFRGFDTMLTLRGESGAEVLPKLEAAITWLGEHGAGGLLTLSSGNGNEPETKVCPLHGVAMKKREKYGDVWWSHQAINPATGEKFWCRGEEG
jgi:hypothetical protein